jgi:hypothetical protein
VDRLFLSKLNKENLRHTHQDEEALNTLVSSSASAELIHRHWSNSLLAVHMGRGYNIVVDFR